jgi:hypothetical protein
VLGTPLRERGEVGDRVAMQREPLAMPRIGGKPLHELVLLRCIKTAIAAHQPLGGCLRPAFGRR